MTYDGMETKFDTAKRHVLRGRELVERQKQLIEKLEQAKLGTNEAERLLDAFECSLAIFENDLAGAIAEMKL